ncbi:SURF1 family protein [Teredinibacter waterburyi]|uniref:SURF1 family protein n=1 Tax=Teredinibacter waterburyi TaxID=1500538 RepID=UPI00165FE41E|nr:SURF1 family protein [Teredinibacter waterburyi]
MASKFELHINWRITLFSALLLPLLISLGVWQLDRGEQKKTIQQSWLQQQALPPIDYLGDKGSSMRDTAASEQATADKADPHELTQRYRRVKMIGEFRTDRYWLVENKFFDGNLGYQIVMPFLLLSGETVLVNRGWVPGSAYRMDDPEFTTPDGERVITGTWLKPSNSRFIDQQDIAKITWPYRLLEVDSALMARQLEQPLIDMIMQLDADSAGALNINWQPINMSPQMHRGYAVQWFSMAAALFIIWFVTSTNIATWLKNIRTPKT